MHLPAAAVLRCLNHTAQVLDCVENVPPDTLLGVWKELSAASEQLRLLMTTRSLFATQDLEDVATTVEIRRLSRRASIDLLRNIVKVSCKLARLVVLIFFFKISAGPRFRARRIQLRVRLRRWPPHGPACCRQQPEQRPQVPPPQFSTSQTRFNCFGLGPPGTASATTRLSASAPHFSLNLLTAPPCGSALRRLSSGCPRSTLRCLRRCRSCAAILT